MLGRGFADSLCVPPSFLCLAYCFLILPEGSAVRLTASLFYYYFLLEKISLLKETFLNGFPLLLFPAHKGLCMYVPTTSDGTYSYTIVKNSPTPERQSGSDKYRSVQHAMRCVWFQTRSMKTRESAWQSLRSGKWRGLIRGWIFTRQLSGFFFFFYSILLSLFRFCAVYTKIKGMSLHVSFTCLVGRVFLVYTTRRFCPSTRPASSKLERDQTTRQIKCRCTNSFGIYTSTVRAASATFIHTTTTTKKRKRFFLFRSSGVV